MVVLRASEGCAMVAVAVKVEERKDLWMRVSGESWCAFA